jgi:aspartate dehydrogenase
MSGRSNGMARVAIAGLGPIGTRLAKALDQGIDGLTLAAVSAANIEKHRAWLDKFRIVPRGLLGIASRGWHLQIVAHLPVPQPQL